MPFGKHKGIRLSILQDDYLSWLSGIDLTRFGWLRESLLAELRHRGFRVEGAEMDIPDPAGAETAAQLPLVEPKQPARRYCLDE